MKVTLLAGGTGGTKLAQGFALVLKSGELTVVANVGDDTEIHGLHVSPDIDALLYTLAGIADAERGWGVRGDTFTAEAMLGRLGRPTWFRLGDADLATQITRTLLLRDATLTPATSRMAEALGIGVRILPATDDRLRTCVETDEGRLDFQEYFVHRRQEPQVRAITLEGLDRARPTAAVLAAIESADAVVIGPSNPIVSIGPILALHGVRDALAATPAPKVAVSPIVAGRALKGPADRMLASLGHEVSALGVARIYAGLVERFFIDEADADLAPRIRELGMAVEVVPTVMTDDAGRAALASAILGSVGGGRP